jgi:hypothetical protein
VSSPLVVLYLAQNANCRTSKLHSGVYEAPSTQEHFVTEPHTGLPMNVGKYGDGRGGTDASETVDGYQRTTGIP